LPEEWRKVRRLIREAGHAMSPADLAPRLRKGADVISALLKRMQAAGAIEKQG
jgi:hypothetical protein